MQTQNINLDPSRASELYEEYRAHRHYATAVDREIARAYRLIAAGRVVIRALESVRAAGLGDDGLPKLAMSRATDERCWLTTHPHDGSATFAGHEWTQRHKTRSFFEFPAGSFPGIAYLPGRRLAARVPMIPLHLRPRQALDEYHILFEAEWSQVIPRDPMLLRRVGVADLWLVVAAWDLTDVEVAALSTRVTAR
jgi:hypothetical protein